MNIQDGMQSGVVCSESSNKRLWIMSHVQKNLLLWDFDVVFFLVVFFFYGQKC